MADSKLMATPAALAPAPAALAPAPAPACFLAPAPAPAARPLFVGRAGTHETEDLARLSRVVLAEQSWDYNVHEAILMNENLGTTLPDDFLDKKLLGEEFCLMTLKGRLMTFPMNWSGRPKLEMANRGLFINQDGRVMCFVCEVMFRGMTSPEVCHIQRHRELAPNCLAHKFIPKGQRIRRNSMTMASDLALAAGNAL